MVRRKPAHKNKSQPARAVSDDPLADILIGIRQRRLQLDHAGNPEQQAPVRARFGQHLLEVRVQPHGGVPGPGRPPADVLDQRRKGLAGRTAGATGRPPA
jgi:hypothetical protein